MYSLLNKLWNKIKIDKKSSFNKEDIFKIIDTDISNLSNVPKDFYDQLVMGKCHGLVLRNALSKREVKALLDNLDKIPEDKKIYNDKNNLYPRGFSSFEEKKNEDDKLSSELYFKEGKDYIEQFEDNFGIEIASVLDNVFSQIGNNRVFEPLQDNDSGGFFPHSQFRTLYSNIGLLPTHCENYHLIEYDKFFKKMNDIVHIKDHYSFFFLLRKPNKGGKIILFDVMWEEGQKWIPVDEIQLTDGTIIDPVKNKGIRNMEIELEEGDLLLFSGGNIWHKVTKILGDKDRVTLGGFFSTTLEDKITCWA